MMMPVINTSQKMTSPLLMLRSNMATAAPDWLWPAQSGARWAGSPQQETPDARGEDREARPRGEAKGWFSRCRWFALV